MMYPRDLIGGLDSLRQQATRAAASTVSLAMPAAGAAVAGLGSVSCHAAGMAAGAAVAGLTSTVSLAKPVAGAAVAGIVSTVSLAKPVAGAAVAGLGSVSCHAAGMAAGAAVAGLTSTISLAKPAAGSAVAGLGSVTRHAAGMVSTREGAVKTAAVVVGGAVGAYFLWPTAAVPAAAAATMKAPGAVGFLISRAAFVANPQLYFQILRTAGPAATAAAFAV